MTKPVFRDTIYRQHDKTDDRVGALERTPGNAGAPGEPGPAGPQGVQGPPGAQGATGYDTSPIGSVITHTSQTVPDGYLLANGQQVNAIDYPQLDTYAQAEVVAGNPNWARPVVGGVQKVQVPDLRDRFIYGAGAKAFGLKSQTNPALANPGEETHVLSAAEMPSHNHPPLAGYSGFWETQPGSGPVIAAGGSFEANGSVGATGNAGGGGAHNNMPPYCVLAFLIKAKGATANADVIQGPPGPQGIQGIQGIQGAQGPQGPGAVLDALLSGQKIAWENAGADFIELWGERTASGLAIAQTDPFDVAGPWVGQYYLAFNSGWVSGGALNAPGNNAAILLRDDWGVAADNAQLEVDIKHLTNSSSAIDIGFSTHPAAFGTFPNYLSLRITGDGNVRTDTNPGTQQNEGNIGSVQNKNLRLRVKRVGNSYDWEIYNLDTATVLLAGTRVLTAGAAQTQLGTGVNLASPMIFFNNGAPGGETVYEVRYYTQQPEARDLFVAVTPAGGVRTVKRLFGSLGSSASLRSDFLQSALADAKGDLLVGTADNVVGRLGLGSNGQVLTADSTLAAGIKWAAPAAGGGGVGGSFSAVKTAVDSTNLVLSTPRKVICDSEVADVNGWYDPATGKFQPTIAGSYFVEALVYSWPAVTAGVEIVKLYKNGALHRILHSQPGGGNNDYSMVDGGVVVEANGTTDYFELYFEVQGALGANQKIQGDVGGAYTRFCAFRVG